MATIRKNQARLSRAEWAAFVDAVNAIQARGAKRPNYRDFVDVHVRAMGAEGHEWGMHSPRQVRAVPCGSGGIPAPVRETRASASSRRRCSTSRSRAF